MSRGAARIGTLWVGVGVVVVFVMLVWIRPAGDRPAANRSSSGVDRASDIAPTARLEKRDLGEGHSAAKSDSLPVRPADGRSEVADGLNAPDGDIQKDLRIVNEIFDAWLSNVRGEGNPIGDNREVTAALCGKNRFGIELIPRDHPALNARGELCDRWGTPFRFHVLSRVQMEIRSAGPDKKFGTPDDAEWAPWPKNF